MGLNPKLIKKMLTAHRSVVKIMNVCNGTAGKHYSNGATTFLWSSGRASTDACVVQYTALSDSTLTITALAIDGADNLWVRHVYERWNCSVVQLGAQSQCAGTMCRYSVQVQCAGTVRRYSVQYCRSNSCGCIC